MKVIALPTRRANTTLARQLAPLLAGGDLLVLSGELGAGKTFFTRALCRGLGLPERVRVTSPTFSLVHEHATNPPVAHADLYRLEDARDVRELGLLERRDEGWLIVVEWGEAWIELLGGDALVLQFTTSPTPRHVTLRGTGARGSELVAALARSALRA
ncbi:MAG: tRNA (adenosine(37)-N6)-threonylcarbamoyltransferase complex ATPase subunit type 1 TsaE [Polyangiaceae bacterium]